MAIETIVWEKNSIKIIDQSQLPLKLEYLYLKKIDQVREAITSLKIRGAPALGIAAALGLMVGIQSSSAQNWLDFREELQKTVNFLRSSRPTAVNLFWALKRMIRRAEENNERPILEIKRILQEEALKILEEDKICNRRIGRKGATLISDGDTVLTHCNAGALATADYGTALGILYRAKEEKKKIRVYVDETRPLLQGARLSAWELLQEGFKVTLICDHTAGAVMQEGKIDKILVGADRVAANGDTANKIGTYTLAVLAREHHIPFYVACPFSTVDLSILGGEKISLEKRSPDEITQINGKRIAPKGVEVYNPAFDITPAKYITAIITEKGIHRPPFIKTLRDKEGK